MSNIFTRLINLAGNITGILPVVNGGTGQSAYQPPTQSIFTIPLLSFTVSSANATVGAVYTHTPSGAVFTVQTTIAAQTTLVVTASGTSGTGNIPAGALTKSSGTGDASITFSAVAGKDQTYTVPAGVVWLEILAVGGGGGGGNSGTAAGATAALGGLGTKLGGTVVVAGGGNLGAWNAAGGGGNGGSTTVSGSPLPVGFAPNGGMGGASGFSGAALAGQPSGGSGGNSIFGGSGSGGNGSGSSGSAGLNGQMNTGGGGGGAGGGSAGSEGSGTGGGAGGGAILTISGALPSTYTCQIGAGGSGQSTGTSGSVGGNGGSGILIIREHYFS
jgi:hypothetical protein